MAKSKPQHGSLIFTPRFWKERQESARRHQERKEARSKTGGPERLLQARYLHFQHLFKRRRWGTGLSLRKGNIGSINFLHQICYGNKS